MKTVIEIDGSGRVVVPKKLRDDLHLVAGTRLTFRRDGDAIVIQPEVKPRGLHLRKGTLVYDAGATPQVDILDQIERSRTERLAQFSATSRAERRRAR